MTSSIKKETLEELKAILDGKKSITIEDLSENSQLVEKFVNLYGSLKYNRDDWKDTPVWKDAYQTGLSHGMNDARFYHMEMVYDLVRMHYEQRIDDNP